VTQPALRETPHCEADDADDNAGMRTTVEAAFSIQVDEFTRSAPFRRLESGEAPPEEYDRFIANLIRAHSRSPQLVAFLYALAPPDASDDLLHNLLEEVGIEEESGEAHPAMLEDLAAAAGLSAVLPELERLAADDLRAIASEPLLYGTLKEVGLSALCEVVAFEFMLSRVARRIERTLATHRGLAPEALRWFHHHSEVDIAHAEQGLQHLVAYVGYYGFSDDEARGIIELTLRDNVFARRYFAQASPTTAARLES
jgi:pyrroloquinoline quinone (PQQ) biosynthesis protein C